METVGLRTEPIKSKMRLTGLYRYYKEDTLVGKGCTICRIPKPIGDYHRSKSRSDGVVARCKACISVEVDSKSSANTYERSGMQVSGWIDRIPKDESLINLRVVPARRYRGWQGARFYHEDGTLAGKICPSCEEAKVIGSFSKNYGHPDGLSTYCKICSGTFSKEYLKLRSDSDPDYVKNRAKTAYQKYFNRSDKKIIEDRKRLHPNGLKKCRVCRKDLDFGKYDVGRGNPSGLALDCKSCKKSKRKRVCEEYWIVRGVPLKCYLANCEEPFEEIDHVVPTSLDGPDEIINLLPMCAEHNRRKHGILLPLWLLDSHPESYEDTMRFVIHFGIDPWGSYVPI